MTLLAGEEWTAARVEDQLLIEMNEGPRVHHRSKRYEINFHDLEAGLYLARMGAYDKTNKILFTVNAIDFTPKLRCELIDARKHGMLGRIAKNSILRMLHAYDRLAFIEHVKFQPLRWRIISLDI